MSLLIHKSSGIGPSEVLVSKCAQAGLRTFNRALYELWLTEAVPATMLESYWFHVFGGETSNRLYHKALAVHVRLACGYHWRNI